MDSKASISSSITVKSDQLPPLPPSAPSTPKKPDREATVRHGGGSTTDLKENNNGSAIREPTDEYDDYENDIEEQGEDDFADTTMLDSVVLPAIASVSIDTNFPPWFMADA